MTDKFEATEQQPEKAKDETKDHGVITAGPEAHENEGAEPGKATDPIKDRAKPDEQD